LFWKQAFAAESESGGQLSYIGAIDRVWIGGSTDLEIVRLERV